jgi:hypothetical protein
MVLISKVNARQSDFEHPENEKHETEVEEREEKSAA